ncbi:MAG: class I SAM-dependent methyltransferase [Candidatus Omnitrophica bacterium]|nr:class I SAM-dependent methyltransferase [Candidatus Omnitrophota bacterium]
MKTTSNYKKHTSKNPLQKFLIEKFYQNLLQIIGSLKPEIILDAGCGEGFTLARLKKESIGKHLEGIDSSLNAISLGKKNYPSLSLKQSDIYNLPYNDNSFDLVICSEVLEHLEHPAKALAEIVRVSKKYCILSVPNEPIFMISNFLRGKNLPRWGNDIEHVNHWSKFGFEKFVKEKGLKLLVMKTSFPWILVLGEKKHHDK